MRLRVAVALLILTSVFAVATAEPVRDSFAQPQATAESAHAVETNAFREWWAERQARPAYVGQEGITVRTGLGTGVQSMSFRIDELALSTNTIEISPNNPLHWIFGAEWNRIGLSFRLTMPNSIDDSETRGTTEFMNFLFQFFGDRYEVDLV